MSYMYGASRSLLRQVSGFCFLLKQGACFWEIKSSGLGAPLAPPPGPSWGDVKALKRWKSETQEEKMKKKVRISRGVLWKNSSALQWQAFFFNLLFFNDLPLRLRTSSTKIVQFAKVLKNKWKTMDFEPPRGGRDDKDCWKRTTIL